MSRRETRRGRSLEDCTRPPQGALALRCNRVEQQWGSAPGYILTGRVGWRRKQSEHVWKGGGVERAGALEYDDDVTLAGDGVRVLAVDSEVVVSPEDLGLL